jgi:hypothetical protein
MMICFARPASASFGESLLSAATSALAVNASKLANNEIDDIRAANMMMNR